MNDAAPVTVICIAGGDGSGKSTQIARLTAFFEDRHRKVAPVSIWDAFTDPAVVSKLPFARPSDVYGYLELLGPVCRTHFLFHALHLALQRASDRQPNVMLLNAYWYKYFATEVAHGGDPAELRRLAAGFPEPDLTFYLSVSPLDALARKTQRSDYESGYGKDDQKFLDFQHRAHQALQALAVEYSWTELDGRSSPDHLTTAMIQRLWEAGYVQAR
jgi:dTMP kinase